MAALPLVDESRVIMFATWVIAFDGEHFRDKTSTRPTFDLNDDIQGIGNICLNGAVRYLDTAL
jgi:hypothetical protein